MKSLKLGPEVAKIAKDSKDNLGVIPEHTLVVGNRKSVAPEGSPVGNPARTCGAVLLDNFGSNLEDTVVEIHLATVQAGIWTEESREAVVEGSSAANFGKEQYKMDWRQT